MAYIYWSFMNVQGGLVLDRMGRKFFGKQAGLLGRLMGHNNIAKLARLSLHLRINSTIANCIFSTLRASEKLCVADREILSQVKRLRPHIILATPTLYPQHYDVDYVKAGLNLKIPTITAIASWDHLSAKGLLTLTPDLLLVWGGSQVQEAAMFHRVPAEKMRITGAPSFDWLFDQSNIEEKTKFYAKLGLNSNAPYILWAASAPGNCNDEKLIVRLLLSELRKHERLGHYQLLIRPHPNDPDMWREWREPNTIVWGTPKFPYDPKDYLDLFNSIYHATAVTGLSTSVFLEAAILDKPCAILRRSIAVPDTVFNQTLHFQYLVKKGYPEATEDEVDLARWLVHVSDGNDGGTNARKEFVRTLIRPAGLECAASKVAADAIVEYFERAGYDNVPSSH
jgi:hypothetical protein